MKKSIYYYEYHNYNGKKPHYRLFRNSDFGKTKIELDNIYYCDPVIKNNRQILKQIKKPIELRKTAKEDKFFYFLNKGYDEKFLKDIYKIKEKKQLYTNND